ncbi:MAG: hypothetical protein D4R64_06420 [Porphyromonadaceae bacterium]|nr:MAG: hypothetical protein D4R64_06420 [Porphyromonadaceae bacterium]
MKQLFIISILILSFLTRISAQEIQPVTAADLKTWCFYLAGDETTLNIPAFTLVTTDDLNFIHKVTDEPQLMDYDNMASLVAYAKGLVLFLAADPLSIHWDQDAFDKFNQR